MSIDAYDDILKRAQDELTPEQQQRLSEVLSCHILTGDRDFEGVTSIRILKVRDLQP